ncbi:MAG: hypothetical protein ACKVHU_14745 [Acidimicrobiales bacterium]
MTLFVLITLAVFFCVKAGWEEQRLADRYPDYEPYRDRTGLGGR